MKTRQRLAVWAALCTVVLWQGLGTPLARGQGTPVGQDAPGAGTGANAPIRRITNQTHFRLPVEIEEQQRSQLQAIRLFVRKMPGEWQQQDAAPPAQKFFTYAVHEDGEYWFSVVAVDNAGRANPSDVRRDPPQLIVVVDTQPPVVDVQPATGPNGETWLRCAVKDANADYQSLKLSYRSPDQAWHPLEALPGVRGVFRVPGPDVLSAPLRVSMMDLAKNPMSRELKLPGFTGGTAAVPTPPAGPTRAPNALALDSATPIPIPPAARSSPEAVAPKVDSGPGPVLPLPSDIGETRSAMAPRVERTSYSTGHDQGLPSPSRQLLNTTRASLDYRLDQVGPSGVGKVEIYITTDEGKTWHRLCEDPDRRSPAIINLPGEGLYGVRLAVTNGNGFGGRPPAPGDAPTCWIEVDMTGPHVQLRDVDPVIKDGALEIRWIATDRNMAAEPISLYYATRKEGPWLPIARGLRNDGLYRWSFPREAGAQFFLRLEAVDEAGNIARCDSTGPILLDMTEPRAQVVGVTGMAVRNSGQGPVVSGQ
jgi:hypothetical protein